MIAVVAMLMILSAVFIAGCKQPVQPAPGPATLSVEPMPRAATTEEAEIGQSLNDTADLNEQDQDDINFDELDNLPLS